MSLILATQVWQRCMSTSVREGRTTSKAMLDRMLRVDHAGEFGAIRIYQGQLAVLGRTPVAPVIKVNNEYIKYSQTTLKHKIFSPKTHDCIIWSNCMLGRSWWIARNGCYRFTHLTQWGQVTHICVCKLTIIDSDNGLSPGWCQVIIWASAGILLIEHLWTNFSEILIKIYTFSFKKMHLKMLSVKWQPFCISLNVLTKCLWCIHHGDIRGLALNFEGKHSTVTELN